MGQVDNGASCRWGELCMKRAGHRMICPWRVVMGCVVMTQDVMGRDIMGQIAMGELSGNPSYKHVGDVGGLVRTRPIYISRLVK
jgi:hypothetical protein